MTDGSSWRMLERKCNMSFTLLESAWHIRVRATRNSTALCDVIANSSNDMCASVH